MPRRSRPRADRTAEVRSVILTMIEGGATLPDLVVHARSAWRWRGATSQRLRPYLRAMEGEGLIVPRPGTPRTWSRGKDNRPLAPAKLLLRGGATTPSPDISAEAHGWKFRIRYERRDVAPNPKGTVESKWGQRVRRTFTIALATGEKVTVEDFPTASGGGTLFIFPESYPLAPHDLSATDGTPLKVLLERDRIAAAVEVQSILSKHHGYCWNAKGSSNQTVLPEDESDPQIAVKTPDMAHLAGTSCGPVWIDKSRKKRRGERGPPKPEMETRDPDLAPHVAGSVLVGVRPEDRMPYAIRQRGIEKGLSEAMVRLGTIEEDLGAVTDKIATIEGTVSSGLDGVMRTFQRSVAEIAAQIDALKKTLDEVKKATEYPPDGKEDVA